MAQLPGLYEQLRPEMERVALEQFLESYRVEVVATVSGLTDELASTRLLAATDMTIAGIVKHLAWSEDSWFQGKFRGVRLPEPWRSAPLETDRDWAFSSASEDRLQDVIALYADACDRSRSAAACCSSLDEISATRSNLGDGHVNLRWLLMHMLDETARHVGHIDLLLDEARARR